MRKPKRTRKQPSATLIKLQEEAEARVAAKAKRDAEAEERREAAQQWASSTSNFAQARFRSSLTAAILATMQRGGPPPSEVL